MKHVVTTIASFLLCLSTAFARTVVSFVGEEVVVSRLEGGSVQRLPVRGEVQAVAANARYAYALVGGAEIVRVEMASGREASRLEVPCCASMLQVSADDRWLVAGGQEAGAARLQVFDLSAQSRPAAVIDLPGDVVREILADGPRFVVASSAAERLPLLSRMFVTVIEGGRVASQDEVPARLLLRWGYVGSRAMVVGGDNAGNVVVTRLGGRGSERIPVRAPDPLGPIAYLGPLLANAASAYGEFSSYVIRVDLERMQQVESGIMLLAGEHLAAVTANDRWLLTTRVEDRQRREFTVGAYCVGCADVRWGHWAGWLPGVPVEMLVVGSQIAVASVEDPFPRPDEFGLTLWEIGENGLQQIGHHRLPGRLSISQLHEQPDFVLLSSADLAAPARGNQSDGGGCAVGGTRSSGFPLWAFLLLLGTCAVRRRALLVAFFLLAVVLPAGAKVIANGATMRIDAGPLQPAPQPNGPAYA